MELLVQQLVNGLAVGSIYALIALGYTMVYGTIKLINFAHGDVYMMGAFVGYYAVIVLKLNVFLALFIAMVACAVLGVVIERVAYKPLRKSTRVAALITAIGVSFLLENAMSYFFGAETRPFPSDFGSETVTLFGNISVTGKQILVFGITVALMALLQFIVKYTKMGKAMRAVAVDEQAAQLMGIDICSWISACRDCRCSCWGVLQYHFDNNGDYRWTKSLCCGCTWWYRQYSWSDGWGVPHRSIRNNG